MSTELSKVKSVRAGHRGTATKMIAKVDSLMAEDSPSPTALAQLKLSLNKKLDVLDQLDDNILNKITDAEVADEISGSDKFKEGLYAAIVKIDHALMLTTTPVAPVVTTATPPPPSTGSKVKLPKLLRNHLTVISQHGIHSGTPSRPGYMITPHYQTLTSSTICGDCFSAQPLTRSRDCPLLLQIIVRRSPF